MARQRTNPAGESVWDYPCPPRLEDAKRRIKVNFDGVTLACTTCAKRMLETSHPPVYYDYVAFYPSRMDACWVEGEKVRAQQGDFYGGWITSDVVGPFKGGPGTWGW